MNSVNNTCIIDDDEVFVYAMKRLIKLKELSKELLHINRVEEALRFLEENQSKSEELPDIILLDINMPVMDGWDFLETYVKIKEKLSKKPKIYMLSSSVTDADLHRALNNPDINGYFTKPLSKTDFNTVFGSKLE